MEVVKRFVDFSVSSENIRHDSKSGFLSVVLPHFPSFSLAGFGVEFYPKTQTPKSFTANFMYCRLCNPICKRLEHLEIVA
jgi:hypothetical protein